jgi:hypothetical protein
MALPVPDAAFIVASVSGKPLLFGLGEDEEIPQKLARKVYGEVEITGIEDYVTADWRDH